MDNPIIGHNVISEIVKQRNEEAATITHLRKNDVEGLVQAIRTNDLACELVFI